MAITYDFANSENWQYVGQQTLPATVSPIGDTDFPISLESPIIGVVVSAVGEKETWNYAGKVFQKIFTGVTVGGNFDSYVDSQSLFFKKVNVIRFNRLTTAYALTFRPPRWVTSITYRVFVYTGSIVDTTDQKLDLITRLLEFME